MTDQNVPNAAQPKKQNKISLAILALLLIIFASLLVSYVGGQKEANSSNSPSNYTYSINSSKGSQRDQR
jgi:hypothetical protein